MDAVILAGDCADPTSPRCVRATMGAAFRQSIVEADLPGLARLLGGWDLPLYGAALAEGALDIRSAELSRAAVAIGNEGHGLSPVMLFSGQKFCLIFYILPFNFPPSVGQPGTLVRSYCPTA